MATPTANIPQPFTSLKELCTTHSQLKQRRYQLGIMPHLLTDASKFVERGRVTGALLADDEQRWYVQSMLDYWSNVLYRADWPEPEATLAPFKPTSLALVA
ncbi:MAG: hypothetical protein AAF614_12915 [Chloroflexota bacterium]